MAFHISHWPNGLCRLGDDKCEEIALEVNYNVFVISSNTRCAGTQCLQLHDIFPLPLRQENIHNDGCPRCIWCIHGHSCPGSHFLAYAQVKVEVVGQTIILLANNSLASAPTASTSTYSCLLQSIQLQWGNSLVHVLSHHNYCGNHGHCDCQVALVLGCIQWHNNVDCCVGYHVGCLLLCDKDDANQRLHMACTGGPLHVQTSVVHRTWHHCCFSYPPRLTFGTRDDHCDDFGHKRGFHLVVLWAFKIGGNQCWHDLSLSQWV